MAVSNNDSTQFQHETDGDSRLVPGRYAAIDIGTVTCRLLVADVLENGKISEVRRETIICNLGVGVDKTGRLAPESIERVGVAIEGFVTAMHEEQLADNQPIPVLAVATSASRDAENADDFKARLARAGLELNIIPGEREAALSFAGASSAFAGERVVVLDVGGGSTEIIAGLAGGDPQRAHSFNVGCRRVTERLLKSDPPTSKEIDEATRWISGEFAEYIEGLRADDLLDGRIVAVAGTATSIVSMREQMEVYDSTRVHGAEVTRSDVDALLARLAAMTVEERRGVVGLNPDRAPVIVAGVLILQQIMQLAGADSFTVSERDILHGIIMAAAAR